MTRTIRQLDDSVATFIPKLSDSGNRVNLGQDMKELDHTVWHDIKKREEFGQKANQNSVKRG